MEVAWTKQLSVGNAVIDSEHQNLIVMIDRIESMIKGNEASALSQELERLEHSLCVHFINEERLAKAVNFPFDQNKQEHKFVLKEFQRMKGELLAKNGKWTDSAAAHYSNFLSDWFTGHVMREDMLMKPVLQTYDYKFWPGGSEGETNYAAGSMASLYLELFGTPAP
ncbi:MAG: hemerythrin family protein [Gallionella sp.]|nr:hemerythrin family protein [Gallionella sp.]